MNRKTPMQSQSPFELVGMQTVLLGMQARFEQDLREMNDLRSRLGLEEMSILHGPVSIAANATGGGDRTSGSDDASVQHIPRQIAAPATRPARSTARSKKLASKVSGIWKQKLAVLEAAGMKKGVRGMPSNKLIAKAELKLKRLGIPVPTGDKPARGAAHGGGGRGAGGKRSGWGGARKKGVVAKTTKPTRAALTNGPIKKAVPVEHYKTPQTKNKMKKAVGANSKARWALALKAGLKPKTVPGKAMLDEARRILAARAEERKQRGLTRKQISSAGGEGNTRADPGQ